MEVSTAVRLDELPAELLSAIASRLDFIALLQLSQTCRSVRRACLDGLVLKNLIVEQEACTSFFRCLLATVDKDESVLARYDRRSSPYLVRRRTVAYWAKQSSADQIQRHFGLDSQVWMRFACADYQTAKFCCKDTSARTFDQDLFLYSLMTFVPHLFVLKHSSLYTKWLGKALVGAIGIPRVLTENGISLQRFDKFQSLRLRASFSFCATLLSQTEPWNCINLDRDSGCLHFSSKTVAFIVNGLLREPAERGSKCPLLGYEDVYTIIGFFSVGLRKSFRNYTVRRMIGQHYYTFILPYLRDIPITEEGHRLIGDIGWLPEHASPWPIPLTERPSSLLPSNGHKNQGHPTLGLYPCAPDAPSWEQWHGRHTQLLATREFLECGTWAGMTGETGLVKCYPDGSKSFPNDPQYTQIDPPIFKVAFEVSPEGEVIGYGSSYVGKFELNGNVVLGGNADSKAGFMTVTLTYLPMPGDLGFDAVRKLLTLRITPFGIGGVWVDVPADPEGYNERRYGVVWLWKRRWTSGVGRLN